VLGGVALRLRGCGSWDPAEQYWGEPEDTIAASLARVIATGPRPQFEFEQLLPGGESPDAEDPILRALALRDRGQRTRARRLLEGLVEWDARCLDAHAHLGAFAFGDDDREAALAHYATGVWIGERSLPEDFDGVLGWGWVDNRPFLRCLQGLTLSAWRLGEHDRAETLCWALLWLNPGDNQGASELLGEIMAAGAWHP
jgi:hypothetical protein